MSVVLFPGCSNELLSYHSVSPGCPYCRVGSAVVEIRREGRRYRVAVVQAHLQGLYGVRHTRTHRGAIKKGERLLRRLHRELGDSR